MKVTCENARGMWAWIQLTLVVVQLGKKTNLGDSIVVQFLIGKRLVEAEEQGGCVGVGRWRASRRGSPGWIQ